MLVLSRKQGEEILIDGTISVSVLSIEGGRIRLGINAPRSVRVQRQEKNAMASSDSSRSSAAVTVSTIDGTNTSPATPAEHHLSPAVGAQDRHEEPSILLAEDDAEMRYILALHLRRQGYRVTECCDGAELVTRLAGYLDPHAGRADSGKFDLVITDIRMPGVFGLSVVEGSRQCPQFPPVILITAFGDAETHDAARRFGVRAVFDKPFDLREILASIREILAR